MGTLARQIRPDTVCINICIHACEQQWEQSLQLFAYLERHLKPSVVSYGAVFTSLGGAHKWLQVLALLQKMPIQDRSKSQVLVNTTLGAFKDSHRWDLALDLCNSLGMKQLDSVGWGSVIAACSKGSQWQAALIFLHRSHQLGIHNTLQTYNWLLNGMKCDGHWRVGLALLQDATDRRLELNNITFSHLLQIWRKWGLWHKALVCLEELKSSKLRADAELLSSTVLAMERNHRLEESRNAIISVKRRLCSDLRDCPNPDSKLREAALLDATWAGAGLPPDVFGILLSRRLGSPIATAVLQGKQPQPVSCHQRLQNVHTWGIFHARSLAESAKTSAVRQKREMCVFCSFRLCLGTMSDDIFLVRERCGHLMLLARDRISGLFVRTGCHT